MSQFTNLEISRQDYVDSEIFKLIQILNPTKHPIEWNIELIGDIRDIIEYWIVDKMNLCTKKDYYPFLED